MHVSQGNRPPQVLLKLRLNCAPITVYIESRRKNQKSRNNHYDKNADADESLAHNPLPLSREERLTFVG